LFHVEQFSHEVLGSEAGAKMFHVEHSREGGLQRTQVGVDADFAICSRPGPHEKAALEITPAPLQCA
jgi:hypothetical protein